MSSVTVVIPFYQKTVGILTRALESIAAQSFKDVSVVVVDDASPLSPQNEVESFRERGMAVQVIRQPNGGPGKARNTGLEAANKIESPFIAFLDSDDIWEVNHLENAVAALNSGYDFYFADYTWGARRLTRFQQVTMESVFSIPVAGLINTFDLSGRFDEMVLTRWPVHISACVIRQSSLGSVRFDSRLKRTSEDQMYFISCGRNGRKVACSRSIGVCLADGDNFFRHHAPGTVWFTETRLANLYFHRIVSHEKLLSKKWLERANSKLIGQNLLDFSKSEVKWSLKNHGVSPRRWAEALKLTFLPVQWLKPPF